jgi:uncharacterized membrane protein
MKLVAILLSTFLIICGIAYLGLDDFLISFCGRFSMSLMLLFSATTHYKYTDGFELIVPDNFDDAYKRTVVLVSADLEVAMAMGLLIAEIYKFTAILVMLYFFAVVPATIIACVKKVNIERANYTGLGLHYLWLRIPLQLFFMVWVYYFGVFIG